jgi:hypothetical protein
MNYRLMVLRKLQESHVRGRSDCHFSARVQAESREQSMWKMHPHSTQWQDSSCCAVGCSNSFTDIKEANFTQKLYYLNQIGIQNIECERGCKVVFENANKVEGCMVFQADLRCRKGGIHL